jgi:S-DNA-T family DNA segregation ATPase FtsK/SpoIIIE
MGEDSGINLDVDILKEILCLEKPQKLLSTHKGSASLLQKKTKTRQQSRLIDQLEAAAIVGPFEGSKARGVHIQT